MHFGVGHNISHGQLPRMTIMGNGEVGIGTINPNAQVHIEADTPFLRLEDTSGGSKRLDLWVENSDGYIVANQSAQDLHVEAVGVIATDNAVFFQPVPAPVLASVVSVS